MTENEAGRAIERRIILSYVPAAARAGIGALLALDDRLGAIVAAARDPLIGQMRLTWWHDAVQALDTAPPPAEPVLRALAADVLPAGVRGRQLAQLADGWEALLALDADADAAVAGHADDRGAALFGFAARIIGSTDPRLAAVGEGWALASLAARVPLAREAAETRLSTLTAARWPTSLRALSGLALLARADLHGDGTPGGVRRGARLLRHRLTGR